MFIKTTDDIYINSAFVCDYRIIHGIDEYAVVAEMYNRSCRTLEKKKTYAEASEFLHQLLESIKNAEV